MFVRFSQGWSSNLLPQPANQQGVDNLYQRQLVVSETHTVSPNKVNEFRLGFMYKREQSGHLRAAAVRPPASPPPVTARNADETHGTTPQDLWDRKQLQISPRRPLHLPHLPSRDVEEINKLALFVKNSCAPTRTEHMQIVQRHEAADDTSAGGGTS